MGMGSEEEELFGASVFLEFTCDRNLELVVFCESNYLVFFVSSNLFLSCNFNEPVTDLR